MLKSELCEGLLTVKIEQLNQSNLMNHKPTNQYSNFITCLFMDPV